MSLQDEDLNELWSYFFNGPLPIVADANLVLTVLVRCMPLAPPYSLADPPSASQKGARQSRLVDSMPGSTAKLDLHDAADGRI